MRIAYIVGPYTGKTLAEQLRNINTAEQVAKEFWRRGFAVICPHMNSKMFDEVASYETFTKGYLEILFQLHRVGNEVGEEIPLVVALPNWETSSGSKNEIALAKDLSLEIMYLTKEEYGSLDN